MLKLIGDLPPDVLGIEASGKVTGEDYRKTLIPAAEAAIARGPIGLLYVVGPDFAGYELAALWDDAVFGFKHRHHFKRVAVVTQTAWIRAGVMLFRPFIRSEIRLFRPAELAAAREWILRMEKAEE